MGITPAWAGKRGVEKTPCLWYTDHPRAGGEKSEEIPAGSTCEGSPPRRRGKVVGKEILPRRVGITPAWAGKSSALHTLPCRPRDHPRMGGEKSGAVGQMTDKQGSPPRRQGKANWHCVRRPALRITPAWAGKSGSSCFVVGVTGDHPRVGGEKSPHAACCPRWLGSPPRGRGKVLPSDKL